MTLYKFNIPTAHPHRNLLVIIRISLVLLMLYASGYWFYMIFGIVYIGSFILPIFIFFSLFTMLALTPFLAWVILCNGQGARQAFWAAILLLPAAIYWGWSVSGIGGLGTQGFLSGLFLGGGPAILCISLVLLLMVLGVRTIKNVTWYY